MMLHQAAFAALPHLRDRIQDPAHSRFRFLDYDELDRRAREAGYPEGWRRSDAEREATRHAVMDEYAGAPVHIFAYGSLMWDPGFYFEDVQLARVAGYERKFCLAMERGRGSPDTPGLMAGLDIGSHCDGLVFRIGAEQADHETAVIWRREMISYGYVPTVVAAETDAGTIPAITFVVDRACDRYAGAHGVAESARLIALAEGMNGTNFEYLDNLVGQLNLLGLDDPHIAELHEMAERVRIEEGIAVRG